MNSRKIKEYQNYYLTNATKYIANNVGLVKVKQIIVVRDWVAEVYGFGGIYNLSFRLENDEGFTWIITDKNAGEFLENIGSKENIDYLNWFIMKEYEAKIDRIKKVQRIMARRKRVR